MFLASSGYLPDSLSDVVGVRGAGAADLVYSGFKGCLMPRLIAAAEDISEFSAWFSDKCDPSLITGPLDLVVSAAGEVWNNNVWFIFIL